MNYQITIGAVGLMMLFPAYAGAQINSNVSASSDTGGNVTSSGGVIHTGDSSASVNVQTLSGTSGGTSTIHIETTVNGQKHEETYTKPMGNIGVSVVATSSGYQTRVWEPGTSTPAGASWHGGVYASTTASSSASSTAPAFRIFNSFHFFSAFSQFFHNLFSWFK